MRQTYAVLGSMIALIVGALPALAAEGDPLAESVLLPGWLGLAMVGLALVLILIFAFLARRGVH